MDDLVRRAMARWPSVPAVHGWLRLGRRGTWFLIDRNAPGFDPLRDGGGSPITSPPIIAFIHRNYQVDEAGNWYFQNGPQRVFVQLDTAPLILRVVGDGVAADLGLVTHTGEAVSEVREAVFDDQGNLFLDTDLGPAMLDDRDLVRILVDEEGSEGGDSVGLALARYGLAMTWDPAAASQAPPAAAIAARFGFCPAPQP